MAWNEKALKQINRQQDGMQQAGSGLQNLDEHDLSAIRESQAKSAHRVSMPDIMGKRITGTKRSYRKTKPATSQVQNEERERRFGFGA